MSTAVRPTQELVVFISSTMTELRDVRDIVKAALDRRGINGWLYESQAGARPETVMVTSLREVAGADVYIGLFEERYGAITIDEFREARKLGKPCFVYIRNKDRQRDQELDTFLATDVYDPAKGVTYAYFDSATALGEQAASDIMGWLVRRHREMTAEIRAARVSQTESNRLQTEVDRLQAAGRDRLPQGSPADYLAQQLRAWFMILGYRFERYAEYQEDFFEWVFQRSVPRSYYDRIVVRGVSGEAELSDLHALRQSVEQQGTHKGWLVSIRRVSQAARDAAERPEHENLLCYTLDELLDQDADFSGYLDWLGDEVRRRGVDQMYVPLACTKVELDRATKQPLGVSRYDGRNGWIDGYIDRWLDDPSKEHISILGEFGTGKTWFALHYASRTLQRYHDARDRGVERPRLPLVISLRDYAKALKVESLFADFFFRKYKINLPNYEAFEQLNRMGKLLLIFDGFDEMAARVDRQSMINNFWQLARVVVPGAKAVLTCRNEHFPNAIEGRALLSAELQASVAALSGAPPQFEVLELETFDNEQIRQVLSFRAGPQTVDQIMRDEQLLDLARRPVMADLIMAALPDIKGGVLVDLARVYLYAVRRKMEEDIIAERTFTSLADKLYFMCELSWRMLSTDQMSLNQSQFPERLQRLFGRAVEEPNDLNHWHYDMMGQTLLIRNADGDYTPGHRSLLEFFVAYKFAAELGVLTDDFVDLARAQSAIDPAAPPQDYTWSAYFQRELDGRVVRAKPPLRAFAIEPMERLVETLGEQPLSKAVLDLMQTMVIRDKDLLKERLLAVILGTRGKTSEVVGGIGGNAATILIRVDKDALKGINLTNTNLSFADFSGADLSGVESIGAVFEKITLHKAIIPYGMLKNLYSTKSSFEDILVKFSPDDIEYICRMIIDSEKGDRKHSIIDPNRYKRVVSLLLDNCKQVHIAEHVSNVDHLLVSCYFYMRSSYLSYFQDVR